MTDNTLTTASGTIITDHPNQYKTALVNDLVPRSSAGVPTNVDGSLGSATYKWLKAFVASGYWDVGDIKAHHSYNGAAAVGQGWFPCAGGLINEANYDAIHGAGSWDIYIITSVLDGKYAPNLTDKYLVGAVATTLDGSSTMTFVGNASNQVNLQHNHSHNHQWHNQTGDNDQDETFDASGNALDYTGITKTDSDAGDQYRYLAGVGVTPPGGGSVTDAIADAYTDLDATNGGSTTQSIQPHSLASIFYIRII